jgi:hypothetical protein
MDNRGAYRFLLILTNMRLGVWMPHPEVVRRAREYLDARPDQRRDNSWWTKSTLLLFLRYWGPSLSWRTGSGAWYKAADREARLWARVLDLRERSARLREHSARLSASLDPQQHTWSWKDAGLRLRAALCWRAMQPTLGMLWAEATGHTSYRATWIKVSAGDHRDALGLAEALRRGAENIVVLDASGDPPGTWLTAGRAISLAASEAAVEIDLNPAAAPSDDGPGRDATPSDGDLTRPWARGTFTRRWPIPELPELGHIWMCKLGWWKGAPWHLRPNPADSPRYPNETHPSWLYDSTHAELYQRLGASVIAATVHDGQLPLQTLGGFHAPP